MNDDATVPALTANVAANSLPLPATGPATVRAAELAPQLLNHQKCGNL